MNQKERNVMFKIYDDKVYFVAETPDINKVIEIFHPTHQISFHTEVALKCLSFKEAIEV